MEFAVPCPSRLFFPAAQSNNQRVPTPRRLPVTCLAYDAESPGKPLSELALNFRGNGGPERIRTFDLRLRRATLYPAELRVPLDRFIARIRETRQSQNLHRRYSPSRVSKGRRPCDGGGTASRIPGRQGMKCPGSPAIHAAAATSPPEGKSLSGVSTQDAISPVALRPLRSRRSR